VGDRLAALAQSSDNFAELSHAEFHARLAGIGANIANWTPEETALAKRLIAAYHQVQPTIVQGALYRLISPRNGSEFSATQTVNNEKTQSVVFAFIHSTQEGRGFPTLKLKGLDPEAEYALSPSKARRGPGTPVHESRAGFRERRVVDELTGCDFGNDSGFRGDFQAAAFRLEPEVTSSTVTGSRNGMAARSCLPTISMGCLASASRKA
jgi:alpha-galactosidase